MFGTNNENVSISEYVNEIIKTIDMIHNPPAEGFELEKITSAPTPTPAPAAPAAPGAAAPAAPALTTLNHDDGTPSDFEYKLVDNSLYIKNTANKNIYILKLEEKKRKILSFFLLLQTIEVILTSFHSKVQLLILGLMLWFIVCNY